MTVQLGPVDAVLTGVLVLATSVWLGGFIAIVIVARAASATMQPPARVAFFRRLGRNYGIVGTVSLLVALGTGGALAAQHPWDATLATAVGVACALVVTSVVGMAQARRMTRLRRRAQQHPDDPALLTRVRSGARRAVVLRSLIGLFSLALLALGVLLAT